MVETSPSGFAAVSPGLLLVGVDVAGTATADRCLGSAAHTRPIVGTLFVCPFGDLVEPAFPSLAVAAAIDKSLGIGRRWGIGRW